MKKEKLDTEASEVNENRAPDDSMPVPDLRFIIGNMTHSASWNEEGIHAVVLLKRPDRQIVLTSFREGIKIKSCQDNGSITFQIIEGKLKCDTRNDAVIVQKGQSLVIHENIKYSLTTGEKTVFLSTIVTGKFHS